MLKRSITAARLFGPTTGLTPEERQTLRTFLPGRSARRLSDGSLAIAAATNDVLIEPEDDFVFGSVVGGTVSLKAFLDSFPNPSPASFQGSTHAGVVEAVLVARRQPVRRFQSIASPADSIVAATVRSGLLSTAQVVHVLLSEERENWLYEVGLGSPSTFACYLRLERSPKNSIGQVTFDPDATPPPEAIETPAFCERVHRREAFNFGSFSSGKFAVTWQ